MRRIGFVSPIRPGRRDAAFVEGLRKLGHVDGTDVRVEMRFGNGQSERLRELVEELVRHEVDVLVAGSTLGALAAKAATTTIPIVFAGSSNPVGAGLVASLARPGGNLTGVSLAYDGGIVGKWPEQLRELVPRLARIALLWSAANPVARSYVDTLRVAARRLGIEIDSHQASKPEELEPALSAIAAGPAQGLVVVPSPFAAAVQERLIAFASQRRLPAIYFVEDFVEAGGLMSYGPSIAAAYARAATYVDRILKGARPANLPVEEPTTRELVVHRGTAAALGLTIPRSILVRARFVD